MSTTAASDPSWSPGTHAVVVGAGPAGVRAALALARTTDRVTLVDRADVPGPAWEERPRPAEIRDVLASPQIVVRAGLEVVGLLVDPDVRRSAAGRRARQPPGNGSVVVGVLVRGRRRTGDPTELPADLVLDAREGAPVPATLAAWSDAVTRQGRDPDGPGPVSGASFGPGHGAGAA